MRNEKMATHSKQKNTNSKSADRGNSSNAFLTWAKKSPDSFFQELWKKAFGGHEKESLLILGTTLVTSILCYFYEMVYGLGCPDTLCEGVHYYRNANYSTSQARWMLRFINEFFGKNVIMPVITVLLYCLMIGLGTLIICRMMKLKKPLHLVLFTSMMVSFPIILHHFAFLYMALAYSFSFLMVVIAIALIRTEKLYAFILSVLCLLMMMGSYQAYIGAVSALALVMLMYDALRGHSVKKAWLNFGFTALSGVIATGINMPFSRLMMKIFHTGIDERVSSFSVKSIFENIGFSLTYSYRWFFSYFESDVLSRNRFYFLIFGILAILAITVLVLKFKEKKIGEALTFLAGLLLLPLGMNFLLVLMPSNGMRDILRYQYVLIFALLFFLHDYLSGKILNNLLEYLSVIAVIFLLIANIIAGNATAFMYKFSYDYAIEQAGLMMNQIYQMDEYKENETPIIMGGSFPYTAVKERYPKIFRYAEQEGGPVFWDNVYGMVVCRYNFFMDFIGVDPVYISNDTYLNAVNSEEYQKMPIWPEDGSIQMIDGNVVIKIYETPPQY